ncbi:succinyl-CoA:glutarate CoA-transferase isoform X6 [Homo sapiens]|uniref:succinyl-CoA:glutarate CoA-transferase isoform X6 n=1 Tax=Homo sapiens TaxID=9606 RepID=UPI001FB15DEB|nr:succinate--hydroxymethylglutarate CoA-transferase isoform X6 [Homo sapiens]XP_054214988.1 succinate--hydroxymethylglutarate CoA-transferase isoform X6 [Homo sapiens]
MLATLARVAALRRTCLFSGRGGGRGLWTGRPQSDMNNIKPLEGVKILDLTRVLAGPFATMNLGDLGAEVIKVERPGAGDDTRTWGPPFVGTESTYYLSVNRNKKSIAVNIKDPKGVKIIKELAAVCDVFVENYVPGKLSAMGLGYEDIDEIAPHIIYCSITGYGQTGPISQRAGYDAVASAVSGLMHITGPEVACLSHIAANYLIGQKEAKRWGTAHGSIVPYQAFKTKDGYIVVGAGNNQQFATVCKILDLPELIDNSKYKTNHLRVHNRKELIKILSERFEEELTSKWLYLFEGSGVPYGPINNMKNVFAEPQNAVSGFQSLLHSLAHGPFLHLQGSARVQSVEWLHKGDILMKKTLYNKTITITVLHNGLVMEMEHPTVGKISVPGPAVRYSKFKMSEARPPPLLGQHTTHILKEVLRYDDRAIGELLSAGVVDQHETH